MDTQLNKNAVRTPEAGELTATLSRSRTELTGYCYRMLGSAFEAEDAVQETWLRAWRGHSEFQGRASLRSWLYRIASNVCLNMVSARQRRARPMDLGPAWSADADIGAALDQATWIEPVPDSMVLPSAGDPAQQALARETVRLAFLAALQLLPPKQRAVLILREVLAWQAEEVAELLSTSVASVNSALQRARATLASRPDAALHDAEAAPRAHEGELLERYVDAFERYDIDRLVTLLHEDATQSMPPYALWLQGAAEIRRWWTGPGKGCAGSHLRVIAANGCPAVAQWRPSGPNGSFEPFAIHVLEIEGGRIARHNSFLDVTRLFPLFGLPARP